MKNKVLRDYTIGATPAHKNTKKIPQARDRFGRPPGGVRDLPFASDNSEQKGLMDSPENIYQLFDLDQSKLLIFCSSLNY